MESKLIHVLLVEDDQKFARHVAEEISALTSSRILLTSCRSVAEALRALTKERFDAALLDLSLPDCQGLACFNTVLTAHPSLPIVVLAASDEGPLVLEAVRLGAQDYLAKARLDGKVLCRVIRYAIERKKLERRLAAQHAVASVLADSRTLAEATPRILRAICESLDWDVGALWRLDPTSDRLRCVAVWHRPEADVIEFKTVTRKISFAHGSGLPGRIWASGTPIWIPDVLGDDNFPRAPVAAREGLHSAFGFPLRIGREFLGVIEFFSRQIQQPDADLVRMFTVIGSQVGQFMVRKQAEEALAEERNILRTLIDTLPDAMYVKDLESRFVLANVGVAHLMGATGPEQLMGKRDHDFFPQTLADQYFADERTIFETGKPLLNHEEPAVTPGGETRWLLTTKAILRDTQGRAAGLVGIGRDITDRKQAEIRLKEAIAQLLTMNAELQASQEQIKAAQMRLIQAEKMECIGTLAAGVAHEVKNPLQTILMGLTYLANTHAEASEDFRLALGDMRDAVKRADGIVRDLLNLSAARELELRSEDLNAILQRSVQLVNFELNRCKIEVECDLAPSLPRVRMDKAKMEQVFINLFVNAVHAMPEGGRLSIRSAPACWTVSTAQGDTSFQSREPVVLVDIGDTGAGIPADKLDKIFVPFFTTKPSGVGTGLGLPIVKQIVDLHGGTIQITNGPAGGARVQIMLKAER